MDLVLEECRLTQISNVTRYTISEGSYRTVTNYNVEVIGQCIKKIGFTSIGHPNLWAKTSSKRKKILF